MEREKDIYRKTKKKKIGNNTFRTHAIYLNDSRVHMTWLFT